MIFNSLDYIAFLVLVLVCHWALPRHRWRNLFLLVASYFFYCYVHLWFLLLILFTTTANYLCGLGITRLPQRKKTVLLLGITLSLGLLGVYKYFNFFVDNLAAVLELAGLPTFKTTLSVMLPVGISFYTFQAMGYSIDVYRGQLEARRDFLDFALFVSFFPQLVAGPIERAGNLLPQVEKERRFSLEAARSGVLLLLWGFFKKLVIADNVAQIADRIFALDNAGFYLLWTGAFAFSIQILADFWAYTDIARGSARLLGFELVRNFDHPYLSRSPADFWRRWHMSLSYWFRDYVYIPLGGSRVGPWRGAFNIMITFLLSGLWHGASWNFVIWGGYHGLLVLGERMLRRLIPAGHRPIPWLLPLKVLGTYALVTVGWMMFRETDLHWLLKLLSLSPGQYTPLDVSVAAYLLGLVFLYSLPLWLHAAYDHFAGDAGGDQATMAWPRALAQAVVGGLLLLGILILRSPESSTFIYFQF